MENLIVELNGIKYLMVEDCITSRVIGEFNDKCKKYKAIQQGIKQIDGDNFEDFDDFVIQKRLE